MLGFFKNLFGSGNPELGEALKNGAFLVDVRTPAEFRNGSAKGAVNIPLDQISKEINKLKSKKQIVVFCQSGMRSGQAKRILEQNGIRDVLNGGGVNSVIKAQKDNGQS